MARLRAGTRTSIGLRHVALLRGINVGRAKRVAMADLRSLVESLGYGHVRTLLNSGNVVFSIPGTARGDAAERIEEAMARRLGVSARVTVLTATELATIVTKNPLGTIATDPSRFLVATLKGPAARKRLVPLTRQDWGREALALGARVAYLWCADGILVSPLLASVGRLLDDAVTTRNWATMTKLNALAAEPAAPGR
jgi:uncharacterized protein (DUF1697 family)